jgi:hypothetical protein
MRTRITFGHDSTSAHHERADQIELVDESLRKSFSGFDPDAVIPELQRSLDEIGLVLQPEQLQAYARAISNREDFELVLSSVPGR